MNNSNFFFCYNRTVSDFLVSEGVQFITVAQDMKTKKVFALFQITEEFQVALNKYKSQK